MIYNPEKYCDYCGEKGGYDCLGEVVCRKCLIPDDSVEQEIEQEIEE